jgi:hypothetical protein
MVLSQRGREKDVKSVVWEISRRFENYVEMRARLVPATDSLKV